MEKAELIQEYFSVNDAATYLGLARITVYRAVEEGRMKAKKFGRNWRIKREWMDEFLTEVMRR